MLFSCVKGPGTSSNLKKKKKEYIHTASSLEIMEKYPVKAIRPSNADIVESGNIVHFSYENVRNISNMYCSLDKLY